MFIHFTFLISFSLLQCNSILATNHQNRIVGGQGAVYDQFPYMVSVQKLVYVYVHVCGGALIKENYVLTAAHCLTNDTMRVRAGLLHIVTVRVPSSEVIERHIHPNYTNVNNRTTNDVAVLKLAQSLQLSDSVQLINLPTSDRVVSGQAIFSGFGSVNSSVNTFSNSLMFGVLNIITLNECKSALVNSTGNSSPVSDRNICTLSTKIFSCYRDDGGPLVQNNTLIGIGAWQIIPCDAKRAPSIFTNVGKYIGWINQQTANN